MTDAWMLRTAIIVAGVFVAGLLAKLVTGRTGDVVKIATIVLFAAIGLRYMGLANSVINLAFGVMTRAAPQLNIFSIGFPLTLAMGLVIFWVGLSDFGSLFQALASEALPETAKAITFRMEGDGKDQTFSYRLTKDGEWKVLKSEVDGTILSTGSAGGFVGATIGMYARKNR